VYRSGLALTDCNATQEPLAFALPVREVDFSTILQGIFIGCRWKAACYGFPWENRMTKHTEIDGTDSTIMLLFVLITPLRENNILGLWGFDVATSCAPIAYCADFATHFTRVASRRVST
jgi:hypothetical protein